MRSVRGEGAKAPSKDSINQLLLAPLLVVAGGTELGFIALFLSVAVGEGAALVPLKAASDLPPDDVPFDRLFELCLPSFSTLCLSKPFW